MLVNLTRDNFSVQSFIKNNVGIKDGWMVLFYSISVISGQWVGGVGVGAGDNERLCAMGPHLLMK